MHAPFCLRHDTALEAHTVVAARSPLPCCDRPWQRETHTISSRTFHSCSRLAVGLSLQGANTDRRDVGAHTAHALHLRASMHCGTLLHTPPQSV